MYGAPPPRGYGGFFIGGFPPLSQGGIIDAIERVWDIIKEMVDKGTKRHTGSVSVISHPVYPGARALAGRSSGR